jgi:hypothetical protein
MVFTRINLALRVGMFPLIHIKAFLRLSGGSDDYFRQRLLQNIMTPDKNQGDPLHQVLQHCDIFLHVAGRLLFI